MLMVIFHTPYQGRIQPFKKGGPTISHHSNALIVKKGGVPTTRTPPPLDLCFQHYGITLTPKHTHLVKEPKFRIKKRI